MLSNQFSGVLKITRTNLSRTTRQACTAEVSFATLLAFCLEYKVRQTGSFPLINYCANTFNFKASFQF